MTERACYKCLRQGGVGNRELRPYGPAGQDVCAGCVFGEEGREPSPELEKTARQQFTKMLMAPGPHLLDSREQVGPRPLKPTSKKN